MCLSSLHAARTNEYCNNTEKPGNQFRQGTTLSSVRVFKKDSKEMGVGDQTLSAPQQGLGLNSDKKDLRDHIQSCLKFVELAQFL